MADGKGGPKYPGPVIFDDDVPRKGYCTVQLEIPELMVEKSFFQKAKEPKNGTVKAVFQTALVEIDIKITGKDGKERHYLYSKKLPEDIDSAPDKSNYKLEKGKVIVKMCKSDPVCWATHAQYFAMNQN